MIFIKLLSRLPLSLLYFIADILFLVAYYIISYRKTVVIRNISNSFPEKSEKEVKAIAKEFYRRFTEYIVETLKSITAPDRELLSRVNFTNASILEPYARSGHSIVLIGSHQFNWEWALQVGCLVLPFPIDAVYQRLTNSTFDKLMLEARSKFGGKPIEKSKVLRTIIKTKDRLRALAIIADQSPRRNSPKYWTEFLHQDTAFFLGPEQIAKATKYSVFFFKVVRVKRGYYNVEMVKLADPPYEKEKHIILDRYARATEALIASDPAGYMWSHKRWKLRREEQD